ncbi:MAG: hypothetical protein RSC93_01690 [Erysipelotrichaceae bacterium]
MDLELIVETVINHLKTENKAINDAIEYIEDDGDYESLFNEIVENIERVLEEKAELETDE